MSYVSSGKSPLPPQRQLVSLGATSPQPSRVQEWHTCPTGTHQASVDSSVHMPVPHGCHLAQTHCVHEAKVVYRGYSSPPPTVFSKPWKVPVHTQPHVPCPHGSPGVCASPGPHCYAVGSPCLQRQLSHSIRARPAVVRTCTPHTGINAAHVTKPPSS